MTLALLVPTALLAGTTYEADPSNYVDVIEQLQPGDTLNLAAGDYDNCSTPGLYVNGVHGTESEPITITGPESGAPATIHGCSGYNIIQIDDSSYVTIKNLVVNGGNLDLDGINSKDAPTHDITFDSIELYNLGTEQSTVGISTKAPAWNWTIRNCIIDGTGTGMYFGNSDGSEPFIAGVVEFNLVQNVVGYDAEFKFQNSYSVSGAPSGPNVTVIRNNVFIKDDRDSPAGDRPNLLVGGFPASGQGSSDRYEIYGNFFFNNPRESLLQASGRVSIHDNLMIGAGADRAAVYLADHDLPLVQADVYNNTIYGGAQGIHFSDAADDGSTAVGNLIFADSGVSGSYDFESGNIAESTANAGDYVNQPSTTLGDMDFYPVIGSPAKSSSLDLSAYASHLDYDKDFNGDSKGDFAYRGAYAGEGINPGWTPDATIKNSGASSDAPTSTGGGGCGGGGGCNQTAKQSWGGMLLGFFSLLFLRRRRRHRNA
jgi:hypothetical protein